jgi:hypothetical protein
MAVAFPVIETSVSYFPASRKRLVMAFVTSSSAGLTLPVFAAQVCHGAAKGCVDG